jgi:archaellum component FlaC
MTDEISDDKFKADVMRFLEIANYKFDGLISDVRTNSFKLERLETKFDGLETKFDGLETKIDGLETKFDGLETKVDGLETKISQVENSLESLTSDVRVLSGQFNDVGLMAIKDHSRIDIVEARLSVLEGEVH